MNTVVALKQNTILDASLVAVLEMAVERAKAGKIRAFVMVETGQDEPQGQHKVRLSDAFNDVRDPLRLLAMVGGIEHQKRDILDSLEMLSGDGRS